MALNQRFIDLTMRIMTGLCSHGGHYLRMVINSGMTVLLNDNIMIGDCRFYD